MLDLGNSFFASVYRDPNAIAISSNNKNFTYSQWLQVISKLCGSLFSLGLKKGDKVLTVLQNNFEACTNHWACQICGIIIVPINWRAKSEEIEYFLTDSESSLIIFENLSHKEVLQSRKSKDIIKVSINCKSNDIIDFKINFLAYHYISLELLPKKLL